MIVLLFNNKNFTETIIHIYTCCSISHIIHILRLVCVVSKEAKQLVEHLFFNCPLIFPFLRAFYDCLKRYFHNIEFHKEQFLLGFKEESLTLNLLILIAKNYIYKCKLKEKIPNIIELKYRIKNYYSLEQYIAIKNNNLKGFEKYWTPVKHVFPDF